MPLRLAALLGLALTLSLLPGASASASPRSDAKRLLALDKRLIGPIEERAESASEQALEDFATCGPQEPEMALADEDEVFGRMVNLLVRHALNGAGAEVADGAGRLEGFAAATKPVRRTARGMATVLRVVGEFTSVAPDVCGYFTAWRLGLWSPEWHATPAVAGLSEEQQARLRTGFGAIRRGGRALRRYGIKGSRVEALVEHYDFRMLMELPEL